MENQTEDIIWIFTSFWAKPFGYAVMQKNKSMFI